MARTSEGFVTWRGHRTWYRVVGGDPVAAGTVPLLVLHGGPGFPHDYLQDLAPLADDGRTVVFYDQLGCGRSDQPDEPSLWAMATFVEELVAVRDGLGLDRVHLFGHSWGGWLALEYALGRPGGIASLVLASTCASVPAYEAEMRRLKQSLPAAVQEAIDRHEAQGTTDDRAYREATEVFKARWFYRRGPLPDHVQHSVTHSNEAVFTTMHGPLWNVTGNLKEWDVSARLGELDRPVLVTSGAYDEMTPVLVQALVDGLPHAESAVFEESAHTAPAEEPVAFREVLASFLNRVEAGTN